jgi:hypothetical protein
MEDLLIIQKIEDMMRYGYQAVAQNSQNTSRNTVANNTLLAAKK